MIRMQEFGVQERAGDNNSLRSSRRKSRFLPPAGPSTSTPASTSYLRQSGLRRSQISASSSSQSRSSIFRVTRSSKRESHSSSKSNISVYTRSSTHSSRPFREHREVFVIRDRPAGNASFHMPPSPISPHTPPQTPLPPLPPHAQLRGRGEARRTASATLMNSARGASAPKTKPPRSRSRLRTFFSRMRRPRAPRSQPLPPPPPVPMIRLPSSRNVGNIGNIGNASHHSFQDSFSLANDGSY